MSIDRYHRQALLPQIGPGGQERLRTARVLLVGCGALGCTIADQLVRAGVGFLRIVDRDIVEITNLQRQGLFEESDVADRTPKAVAAARRLARVNAEVSLEPIVADVHPGNVEQLIGSGRGERPLDLILDGTDSVETRFLLNDAAVKHRVPWVYGACVGSEGRVMAIVPGQTPCLRCVFHQPPSPGELPTCDTAGVLGSAAAVVGSLQVVAALKLLTGATVEPSLTHLDVWTGRFRYIDLHDSRRIDCPTCGQRKFEFLENRAASHSTSLCGRDAVQVRPQIGEVEFDLNHLAQKLAGIGQVQRNPYLVRCQPREAPEITVTVFADGRAIVQGTTDTARARSLYARFVGA